VQIDYVWRLSGLRGMRRPDLLEARKASSMGLDRRRLRPCLCVGVPWAASARPDVLAVFSYSWRC